MWSRKSWTSGLSVFLVACAGSTAVGNLSVPNWFLNPPEELGVVGTASAVSRDLGIARNQAVALARADLSAQLEIRVEGRLRTFQQNAGSVDPVVTQSFDAAVKQIMVNDLVGVRTESVEAMRNPEGEGYLVYALVVQDVAMANRAVLDRMRAQEAVYAEFQKTRAFEELNEEIRRFEESRRAPGRF